MNDVILIAGLGPSHLELEDLKHSYFDASISENERNAVYEIGKKNYNPLNLTYKNESGIKIQLLRRENNRPPVLITTVLQDILKRGNIKFKFVDSSCVWNNEKMSEVCKIVCLSTSFMWSEKMLDHAMSWIKSHICYDTIIVGGQYATLKKEFIINKYKDVDFLITGDAELSLVQLICEIQEQSNQYSNIPNLIYRTENGVLETDCQVGDINQYHTPNYEGEHIIVPYISMRGCVYNCKFCALRHCVKKWQYCSTDKIIQDWQNLVDKNSVRHIDINDSTFFIPYSRIQDLLPRLRKMNVTWEANARADTPFKNEDVAALETAGCKALYFGFESMSDTILGNINKQTSSDLNRRINELFANSQIYTMMSFIVGFPGETPYEFNKTREYLLHEHYGHFNIYVFELEDKCMPIWSEHEKYDIELYEDDLSGYLWKHGGTNWKHCGMDSHTANKLRNDLLKEIRLSENTMAIHKSWQYDFEYPFVPEFCRQDNLKVELLLDKLVHLAFDYHDLEERRNKLKQIIIKLKRMGIE